ncbi:polyribonucleotide nucleotidyltransferase [Candidatus Nephthysia bennettiae]|uniref:Polyribonucleotide nucleotidyltransferase n=1 Tax=Candidatus Nephthysia bennettiae TaxID=3127016 RepID=A0A934KDF6_9BACT|nr:polyribonucleotide nucleotidyltransferase [Candidatus Dormibacteraeota bacterium]MBJ7611224.1 polyribonucleotide nucleotidyltransferase [Candidatus Dormibacteraeota bacterium]
MAEVTKTLEIAGRPVTISTGTVAEQASGAVLIRTGDTVVLCTAIMSREPREGIDFFPLTVDYEEKLYAAGKIPGAFLRREGRPSEQAILTSRLTDRPIRPLFPEGFRNDVQVVSTVLSVDQEADPAILSMNGASAALTISDIPFQGPIGAVRVGYLDGQLVVNPPMADMDRSELDLVVAGTRDAILMVEAGARGVTEQVIVEALEKAHEEIGRICESLDELRAEVGKPKLEFTPPHYDPEVVEAVREFLATRLDEAAFNSDKAEREKRLAELKGELRAALAERWPESADLVGTLFEKAVKDRVRQRVIEEGIRIDGRGTRDIRAISVQVGVLPRTHGSGMFKRGQTQALTILTLGTMGDAQKLDGLGLEESKRYMHHYNMPPFSTGEAKPLRSPGRREIGHGALAERALVPVIPEIDKWPYTMRLVSEILSSNGSTSMASVCGSTLALMDAGVPIKAPVAGIAMGLVTREGGYAILTDIQGVEDALGDMDFKVAGTADGITALQMDIKIKGLSRQMMGEALEQAREARLTVLDKMLEVIPEPRREMSPFSPRITTLQINPDKIRDVIGSGGKVIRKIVEETGAQIDVEDDGTVFVASSDQDGARRAIDWIKSLTDEVEVGRIYRGKVVRIMPFGAFVEVLPNQDGLVHISKLTDHRVERVEEVANVGDEIQVKATEIDSQGRLNLSRQEALEELASRGEPADEKIDMDAVAAALASPPPAREQRDREGGGYRGGRGGGRDREQSRRR